MDQKKYNYIAIDIAKVTLEVCTETFSGSFPYDNKGLKALIKKIHKVADAFVICEATGGYERNLLEILHAKDIPVALTNPARVRAFAQSEGVKAKSDPIDAKMLLRFAQEKKPKPTPPPSPERRDLEALMDRREQLTGELAREKNRLKMGRPRTIASIKKMIVFLDKEIAKIEEEIRKLIDEHDELKEQDSKMQAVTGVGSVTSWTILAFLPEITDLSRNEIVALAGIAPFNKDSGKTTGRRSIQAGRAKVRRCLYMAAQTAAQHNEVIKAYVNGLKARGKHYKMAIVAAMRKLLIHLQSILKNPQKCLA